MSDADANKEKIKILFDRVLNGGDDYYLDELIAADYIEHNPVPGQEPGAEGVKNKLKDLRAAFPGIRFFPGEFVAEGDLVAVSYRWEATHNGPFMGLAPTGKRVSVEGMDFYKFKNGKLAEHRDCADMLGLMVQLRVFRL
ncbi:ester cyclase [Methanolacinia paynteri]|uniref:ester cyclase n=1 Tax=Methanolacinia paynteri TaxID=230356 RepID=UPI00064FAEB7|nr:ester cyclase [Methanolacinia paynteri]